MNTPNAARGMNAWEQLVARQVESDRLWDAYEAARKRCEAASVRWRRLLLVYNEASKALEVLWAKQTKALAARERAAAAEDRAFAAWRAVALAGDE